jgi:hypothetical protein
MAPRRRVEAWCHNPGCWGRVPATKVVRRYYTGKLPLERFGTRDRYACDDHAINPMLAWEWLPGRKGA